MMTTPSPDPNRRLRVLLVAEAANPNNTSVALIGWSFSRAIAQLTDAHLAFELRNRADIVATGLAPAEFTAIDNRHWQGAAWNITGCKTLRRRLVGSRSSLEPASDAVLVVEQGQEFDGFASDVRRSCRLVSRSRSCSAFRLWLQV